jgi:hypothetical protein
MENYITTFNDPNVFSIIAVITGFIWYFGHPMDILTHPISTFVDGILCGFFVNLGAHLALIFCPPEFRFVLSTFMIASACFSLIGSFNKETRVARDIRRAQLEKINKSNPMNKFDRFDTFS